MLTSRDLGRVEFVHLSFQEYLAACHVAGHELGAALADRAGDPRWEEVILLAMSRPGVFRPFMSRALERGDVDTALLRQCLREALEIRAEPFEIWPSPAVTPSTALREESMTIGRARFGTFQLTGRPPSEAAVTVPWPRA